MFFDLKKDFDGTDHIILTEKFMKYGIRKIAMQCVSCYLKNKKTVCTIK